MLEIPEHRRRFLAEVRHARLLLEQARAEHRRALEQERGTLTTSRVRLREDRRQHRRVLDQVRSRMAEERRYHREALAANKWLLALVDRLLPLWGPPRRAGGRPPARIQPAPDARSGARPMGRPSAAPYPGAG
ncbi:MAG: hypothetical protein QN173_04040 [Armatimonadota bacterium]|nr:hypothetical protein [Armatimonadota bacterium]MDR7404637.1 hypothetical protein [Armatimonadota bacterium]MDR7506759.1 hypothetical protein [Armatimonadota bacterium]MDR7508370.1 hypothetical protein [Armatimonadota bacterium]MDR7560235.1 hypothetical protein [Armatimonadota bacterium]